MPLQPGDTSQNTAIHTAVLGAGSIGTAFAIVFSSAGHRVNVFDSDPAAQARAAAGLRDTLGALQKHGLLDESPDAVIERISFFDELAPAVAEARWVQECVPEVLELKMALFAELDELAPPTTVLASSSSAIVASKFAADLRHRSRCLVAHPGNPPFLLRVLEIVPAAFTAPEIVATAQAFVRQLQLKPVLVRRELEGFVFNRLQGALLREAYCLVRDGVASVEDIDTLVRDGLGLRWSVIGPFETADLNTRGGIGAHARKLGPAYARMGAERGQDDPWTEDLVADVTAQRRSVMPLEDWGRRVAWRDRMLMRRLATMSTGNNDESEDC